MLTCLKLDDPWYNVKGEQTGIFFPILKCVKFKCIFNYCYPVI